MNAFQFSRTLGLTALALIAAPLAIADESGWYGGASVGRSTARIGDDRISAGLGAVGLSTTSISNDDRSTGYKVFGGYRVNRYFGLEGGYVDLGTFGFKAVTQPAGTLDGNIRLRGLNLDALGFLPITDKLAAFGRAGVIYADARDSFSGSGAVRVTDPSPSRRAANYKLGVGLQYAFTEALAMRGEVERYRVNDAVGNRGDINLLSIGLIYRFGAESPSPVRSVAVAETIAPTPAPVAEVAVAPTPAPIVQPVAVPTKMTFSADSLFDFNSATVNRAGEQALASFAESIKGADYQHVTVTGHADRIGSKAYNAALSERRAEAVKQRLVVTAGLPAGRIDAKGVGATAPVTRAGECKGTRATTALIACLQRDRRVDVEVTATR